jgi:rhamnosyl/mannosyltransferase
VVHWHSDVAGSEFDWRLALAYPLYRPLERALLRRCSRVILTSPPYLDASPALAPWRSKCSVIPYGLDAEGMPQPDQRSLREADDRWWGNTSNLRVLAIGRLAYFKGHAVLIRAAAEIQGRIVIAGEGPMRRGLEKLIAESGVGERVTLAGDVRGADLHALICSCDCLALPSIERTESFGIVLAEAMRFGKPVVASDIAGSGVGWVARDGETALMVPPGEPHALARALSRLAADVSLRQRLGEAGRRRFFREFLIDPVADRIQMLYADLIASASDDGEPRSQSGFPTS